VGTGLKVAPRHARLLALKKELARPRTLIIFEDVCDKVKDLFNWRGSPENPLRFSLTFPGAFSTEALHSVQVLQRAEKGNPVRIGDGPAAVAGDERRICHCFCQTGRRGQ